MSRTLALVTGSTQGIGLAVAKELAIKHNYHVLLGVRNIKAGEEIASGLRKDGHQASVVELDLNSPESINKAVKHIDEKYGHLDVLINNAGVLLDRQQGLSTWDLFSKTFTTNVVGTGCLSQSILPLLRKAKNAPPRIVFVSSVMGSLTKATDETTIYYNIDYKAYDASKAAVNMLMLNFARELSDVGGKVNSVCPGLVKTGLSGYHEWGTSPEVGAERVVEMATIEEDGPTRTFKHPYKRHVNYCRRAQAQRKGRPKSCTSCRIAKTKCDFGQPCSRCTKKDLRCTFGRPARNGAATSIEHCQDINARPSNELEAVNGVIPCEPPSFSLDLDDFASEVISSPNTISTDPAGLMPAPLDVFPPGITNDMQIRVPPRSLSSKGDLTRVSNRLSSMQHASRVIMQMLYAYPQMMLRRQTFPPFIHPHWHLKTLPETLGTCMSLAQLFALRTPETQSFLWRMVAAEEERFREMLHTFSPREVHLCLEAMIIYMMMSMSEPDSESKERTSRLFETAELIGSRFLDHTGSYSTSEISEPSSTWQDWIFAESRRRMSCLWLIISCVITIENGRTCSSCSDLHNLPLPSSKLLWEARSLEEWQTEKAFFDMSCPIVTLGELVEAKANAGNPVEAHRLQGWEMGSDKMTAMLNIAVDPDICQRTQAFSAIVFLHQHPLVRRDEAPKANSSSRANAKSLPQQPRVNNNTMAKFLAMRKQKPSQTLQQRPQQKPQHKPSQKPPQISKQILQQRPQQIPQQIPQQPQPMPLLPSNPSTSDLADNDNDFKEFDLVPEPTLCKEQQDLLGLIILERNIFFTGSAGCGKSTVLKAAVKKLRAAGKIVHITAPTGRAALGVNGVTPWSYTGWTTDTIKVGLGKLKSDSRRPTVKARLMKTDVLVIDEISMVENHHFQRTNECLKSARCRSSQHNDYGPTAPPFDGVQLLVTGDFCQLPPVKPFGHCMYYGSRTIADDKRSLTEWNCDSMRPCGLFAIEDQWNFRSAAWEENRKSFERLPGGRTVYQAIDGFDWREHYKELEHYKQKALEDPFSDIPYVDGTLEQCKESPLDAYVEMKINARVMLKINLDTEKGLVNGGSQGIVIGWEPYDPAKLPNTKKATLLNLDVLSGHHADWRAKKIQKYAERRQIRQWPIVRFNNEPHSVLYRTQLPLVLAWAVSIHKSQGMTLTHVMTDLSQAWEQALKYAALSRVTSLDGLAVLKPGGGTSVEFLEDKFGRALFTELKGNT
ncbi:short chain dehydrogenase family [Fusarium acutatum]|uniref:ATP-dependent DNA helicase n=1 Tax=Fusarium acutatum TaxID=78861 RepID=A0A8H4JJV4_9HYPO|nr:short chain dehydrogenase family [Fusarium acutatum]